MSIEITTGLDGRQYYTPESYTKLANEAGSVFPIMIQEGYRFYEGPIETLVNILQKNPEAIADPVYTVIQSPKENDTYPSVFFYNPNQYEDVDGDGGVEVGADPYMGIFVEQKNDINPQGMTDFIDEAIRLYGTVKGIEAQKFFGWVAPSLEMSIATVMSAMKAVKSVNKLRSFVDTLKQVEAVSILDAHLLEPMNPIFKAAGIGGFVKNAPDFSGADQAMKNHMEALREFRRREWKNSGR